MVNSAFVLGVVLALPLSWYFFLRQTRSRTHQEIVPRRVMMGNFNQPDLKKAICANIRANLILHGDGLAIVGDKKDALLVKWCIENEYITKEALRHAVHEGICQVGRRMFEWHLYSPHVNYPDHALSPEALGYAIKYGEFSSKEIAQIRFDHGETSGEYIQSSHGLLEKIILQLSKGTVFFDFSCLSGDGDLFPAHDHSCC